VSETGSNGAQPGGTTTFGDPASEGTLADRAGFLSHGLSPLACRSCGAGVLVRKGSPRHTSIQWTSDPATTCPVFAEHVAAGGDPALRDTCERLADSIDAAVTDGSLPVGDGVMGASDE
jgi:hypothetical protein